MSTKNHSPLGLNPPTPTPRQTDFALGLIPPKDVPFSELPISEQLKGKYRGNCANCGKVLWSSAPIEDDDLCLRCSQEARYICVECGQGYRDKSEVYPLFCPDCRPGGEPCPNCNTFLPDNIEACPVCSVQQTDPVAESIARFAFNQYTEGVERGHTEAIAYLRGYLGEDHHAVLSLIDHFQGVKRANPDH